MAVSTFYNTIKAIGLPCAYSHFKDKDSPTSPPYIVYMGAGQDNTKADNTYYYSQNHYQVEYYFTVKNEATEAGIESALLSAGYHYEKSEDVWIEDEGVFVIYYTI